MADGSVAEVTEYVHPDPAFQALLEQRREAELLQAIHRARPIRRGTDRPLTIDIVTSVPLDVSVHQAVTLEDWLRVSVEEMLTARGMMPADWAGKWAVLRDQFETADAVRKAAGRDGSFASANIGQALYRESYIDDVRYSHNAAAGKNDVSAAGWPKYRYRLHGRRKGSVVAIDIDQHPAPRAAWAAKLGIDPAGFAVWEMEFPDFSYLHPVESKADSPPLQPVAAPSLWADIQIVEMKPVNGMRRTALMRCPRPLRRFTRRPVWSKRPPLMKRDVGIWLEAHGL
jgi:hypothetical protein